MAEHEYVRDCSYKCSFSMGEGKKELDELRRVLAKQDKIEWVPKCDGFITQSNIEILKEHGFKVSGFMTRRMEGKVERLTRGLVIQAPAKLPHYYPGPLPDPRSYGTASSTAYTFGISQQDPSRCICRCQIC